MKRLSFYYSLEVIIEKKNPNLQLIPSLQIPLLKHGFGEQSSILFSQFVPLYPALQLHENAIVLPTLLL